MQKIRGYSSKTVYIVDIILCILLCAFIFKMSGEVATESAERSGSISDTVAELFVKDFAELDKAEQEKILLNIDHIIRKIAHFCMYAALGALFAFESLYHKRSWRVHLLLPWLFATLYAASDELHQSFVPGRGPLFSDVVLDSCGSFCGVLFALLVAFVIVKRAEKKG